MFTWSICFVIVNIHLSPLFSDQRPFMDGYDIEVVDNEIWQVKTGLLHAWNGLDREKEEVQQHASKSFQEKVDNVASSQLGISCNAATRTAIKIPKRPENGEKLISLKRGVFVLCCLIQ
ncbi:uncharacterized protein [Euphorbia lathyris]|uniref:uncharacterized protein isoform X2 n=1 Tax=Euphorbia lathyris TaxID=212925 RepID=UPI003313E212